MWLAACYTQYSMQPAACYTEYSMEPAVCVIYTLYMRQVRRVRFYVLRQEEKML